MTLFGRGHGVIAACRPGLRVIQVPVRHRAIPALSAAGTNRPGGRHWAPIAVLLAGKTGPLAASGTAAAGTAGPDQAPGLAAPGLPVYLSAPVQPGGYLPAPLPAHPALPAGSHNGGTQYGVVYGVVDDGAPRAPETP
jgi:hypothetical protein